MSSQLIRQDLIPIGVGYALFMIVLAVGLMLSRRQAGQASRQGRRPAGRRMAGRGSGWALLALNVARDMIGGYVLLMAVVVLYYYGVARVGSNFLDSAFTGTALLLGLALPVFAAASLLSRRRGRERRPPDRGDSDRAGS
jgi:Family of unknown function (DUF6256)